MVYSLNVSTPANTPQNAPVITQLKMTPGLIYRIEVYFPPGSSGLVGVAAFVSNVQWYPSNRGAWFIGDDILFGFDDRRMFTNPNGEIDLWTYNLDTVFDHTVLFNIGLLADQTEINSLLLSVPLATLDTDISALIAAINAQTAAQQAKTSKITGQAPVSGG